MSKGVRFALLALLAVGAGAAGYAVNAWWRAGAEAEASAALMSAQLTDVNGAPRTINAWRGQVLIVNFWATWCTPCREEIPVFIRLQERHRARGLQFIGLAIDQPEKVDAFVREFRINYPVLLGGMDAVDISRRAGNRLGALPFTVLIDRSGRLAAVHLGVLRESQLESMLERLL